ncbi:OmpA family protein [Nereida sp. MMG025]|uniref:OmpA family protein n=1 Tax=Nereida sp. MMG025 TaxID=2909981 RepID=UPI001F249BA9|nr:OmpA family protein [Nereida sp. MMG025]MCF6444189.1 OmpA family protein [Nereida sp. MMG025]
MILNRTLILSSIAALSLSACSELTITDPDDPNRRTKDGAIIGGLAGVAAGLANGDTSSQRREQAVIGGLLGAGAGALVGNQLDKQAAELEQDFSNGDIRIVNTGSELIVTMPQDILFAVDSAAVRPDLQNDLRALANNLRRYPDSTIDVLGHTDDTGDAGYNQNLSTRRAQAVADVLINAGVESFRLRSIGRGESVPIATNLSPEGRAKNRRVEFIIRPN